MFSLIKQMQTISLSSLLRMLDIYLYFYLHSFVMFSILMLVLCYFERFIFLVIALLYLVVSKLSHEHLFFYISWCYLSHGSYLYVCLSHLFSCLWILDIALEHFPSVHNCCQNMVSGGIHLTFCVYLLQQHTSIHAEMR